jgi:hypothetical protein
MQMVIFILQGYFMSVWSKTLPSNQFLLARRATCDRVSLIRGKTDARVTEEKEGRFSSRVFYATLTAFCLILFSYLFGQKQVTNQEKVPAYVRILIRTFVDTRLNYLI